jgi:hypothetical protein
MSIFAFSEKEEFLLERKIEKDKILYHLKAKLEDLEKEELYDTFNTILDDISMNEKRRKEISKLSKTFAELKLPSKYILEAENENEAKIYKEILEKYKDGLIDRISFKIPHPVLMSSYVLWSLVGYTLFNNPIIALIYGVIGFPIALPATDEIFYNVKIPTKRNSRRRTKAAYLLTIKQKNFYSS